MEDFLGKVQMRVRTKKIASDNIYTREGKVDRMTENLSIH